MDSTEGTGYRVAMNARLSGGMEARSPRKFRNLKSLKCYLMLFGQDSTRLLMGSKVSVID